MTRTQMQVLVEQLASAVVDVLKKSVDPLKARIEALETRPAVKFAGTWRDGDTYPEGRLVQHKGGLWLAIATTDRRPGVEDSNWRLVVKSGTAI